MMTARRYRKTAYVWAEPATMAGSIDTPEGRMEYEAGDYIVADSPPTHVWPVKREIFERTHEPLPGEAERIATDRELAEFADVMGRMR
jgi:hypothetical protein